MKKIKIKYKGFPGWHIECSAMSMKYLGETFDIHTGGEDLRSTHHPNEIAQSEGATGKKFVNYWLHGAFLKVDGKRMGKSLGNAYTITDILNKGFEPLALRYLYLTGKYNEPLNFTWKSLEASQTALNRLRQMVLASSDTKRTMLSGEKEERINDFRNRFNEAINDDLNTPKGLAILSEVLKSNIPSNDKYDLAMSFDEVLGLGLAKIPKIEKSKIPNNIKDLIQKREELRKEKMFKEADDIRDQLVKLGYDISDKPAK